MAHFTFHRFYAGFRYAAVAATVLLISCDDELESGTYSVQPAFDVHVNSSWNKGNVTTRGESTDINIDEIENGGDRLYLVTELENLDSYSAAIDDKAKTRGTTVTESNFPQSFGVFAICYDQDAQMNNSTGTVYAENAEIKKQGSGNLWQADGNKLQWIGNGRLLFNAYAPYTSDKSNISYSSTTGMPYLRFSVNPEVKDQIDLLTAKAETPGRQETAVPLNFGHALSAITVRTGDAMLAGNISKVTISGVYGSGKLDINTGAWTVLNSANATYTAETEVALDYDTDKKPYADSKLNIAGTNDGLTFFMIPQQLGENAKLTIVFTDKISNTERTLTAAIGGNDKKWEAGKLYTYSISSTGVLITPVFDIKKEDTSLLTGDKQDIPFTGIMHELDMTAYIKVFQYDSDNKETNVKNVPAKVNVFSSTDGGNTWKTGAWDNDETVAEPDDCTKPRRGSLILEGQSVFNAIHAKYPSATKGTYTAPIDLSDSYNHPSNRQKETANSYIVSDPGYFIFPAVYGNALRNNAANTSAYTVAPATPPSGTSVANGMMYYVDHNNNQITTPYITDQLGSGEYDAILLWSDAPGLIDKVEYKPAGKGSIQFRVQKNSIMDGNAVIALRKKNATGYDIVWSWYIWVTSAKHCGEAGGGEAVITHAKDDNDSGEETEYHLMNSTLGYSPSHGANPAKSLKVKFEFDLKGIPGNSITFDWQLDAVEASVAGDNVYFQWGRKDAMLPGIYTKSFTAAYTYSKNDFEFTMFNKPIYDQYEGYEFCSSVKIGYGQGMNIGETIRYPYAFIMGNPTLSGTDSNFRLYWQKTSGPYLSENTRQAIYNAWNAAAYQHSGTYENNSQYRKYNNQKVTKTIYDPCPPGFNVPNTNAFGGLGNHIRAGYNDQTVFSDSDLHWDTESECWVISTNDGKGSTVKLHSTGVRDYCLTKKNWAFKPSAFDLNSTWPAFSIVTYIATAGLKDNGKTIIFFIDNRGKYTMGTGDEISDGFYRCGHTIESGSSYGFTIWPEFSDSQKEL